MEKEAKIAALVKQQGLQRDTWTARDITPLACKEALELSDWVEITGIAGDENDGQYGLYKITTEAISFAGMPLGHLRSQPVWEQPELLRQNKHRLIFPCTSQELVAFVDADDGFCGSLFGVISEAFRKAVEDNSVARAPTPIETNGEFFDNLIEAVNDTVREAVKEIPIPSQILSDAALGAEDRKRLVRLSEQSVKIRDGRQPEWDRWNAAAKEIAKTLVRRPSKRELARRVIVKLNIEDKEESVRKRLPPIDQLWTPPAKPGAIHLSK